MFQLAHRCILIFIAASSESNIMRKSAGELLLSFTIILACPPVLAQSATSDARLHKISAAVNQAITDEIYYYGMEDESPILNINSSTPVYIEIEAKRLCRVIYRLYPHGEVFRRFYITQDGLAILAGDARKGFLWWRHRNMYVGQTTEIPDGDLMRYKQTWAKGEYKLVTGFDKTELIMRQARRIEVSRKLSDTGSKVGSDEICPS